MHTEDGGEYELIRRPVLPKAAEQRLEEFCHAVLVDMRLPDVEIDGAIRRVADIQDSVALLCLCRSHSQLESFQDLIHLVDDYLLLGELAEKELVTRIAHAIRRRRHEDRLALEENLLRSLLENIPDAIYFKDLESRFVKVNKAMALDFGFEEPARMEGKSDFDLFEPERAESAFEDEQRIIRSGEPLIGKIEQVTHADGERHWVTTTKVPLADPVGRIMGTMGISREITDLKKTEQALARERNQLWTILNTVPDRVFVKDTEGRYLTANQGHVDFLGAPSRESLPGKTIFDFYPEERACVLHEEDLGIIRENAQVLNKTEHVQREGREERWYLTSKVPFANEDGEILGLVGIARDITAQKENERKLRETIELLNDTQLQLIEAEKLKTVGRLAAGVAHEVKNPLAVVRMGIDQLRNELRQNPDLLQTVDEMEEATQKANDVVFQLLEYSSPRAFDFKPTDLNELIRRVLALTRHNFKRAHVRVEEQLEDNLPQMEADASKLDQVFINLFLNAIQAMSGGGKLIIRTISRRMVETGDNVSGELSGLFHVGEPLIRVDIEDTGPGIPPEAREKIFEPFYSTHATGEGTGLGLSVTRSIVDLHRGHITLENKPDGSGARARLFFPTQRDYDKK